MTLNASPVYAVNLQAYNNEAYKIIVNQGGTRSGKTYSLIMLMISIALAEPGKQITVVSLSVPHLKQGTVKDFLEIMQNHDLYSDTNYNKTDRKYTFDNRSYIEFVALDNPGKARGPGRDILFVNEANLIKEPTFRQLLLRTRGKVFIDYNPADEYHWIYDRILTRDDVKFIQSTYLDNYDFLPQEQIKEIERLKDVDENLWRVYGLGERGISSETIYKHWELIDGMPSNLDDVVYGIDFGFHNPSTVIKVGIKDNCLHWEELLYESGLTNPELIRRCGDLIDKRKFVYPDPAEPDRLKEFSQHGFKVKKASKDVKAGIDSVRGRKLFIVKGSVNLLKEIKNYKYKVDSRTEEVLDDPVKFNDHLMDAGRYASYSYFLKPKRRVKARSL